MYNSAALDKELMGALNAMYPNTRALAMIVSGNPGCGKSTLLASVPVPEGKKRYVIDMEDSMKYLDAGLDAQDVYTPRRQAFSMKRFVFPSIEDVAKIANGVATGKTSVPVGAVVVDNLAILQDDIVAYMTANATNFKALETVFTQVGAKTALPNAGLAKSWVYNHDGMFWSAAKAFARGIIMSCLKSGIHYIASTEQGNVWVNYGKSDAKITGQKAKIWDVWYRYSDVVVSLNRDPNKTDPPMGQLYKDQPKMRLQGFNPTFKMDWAGFIEELKSAKTRTDAMVPKDLQIAETTEVFSEVG